MGRGSVWNPGSVSFGEILLINVLYLIVSSMTRNALFYYGLNLPCTVCRRCSPEGAREDSPKPRIRRNKTCNINKMKMKRKLASVLAKAFSGKSVPEKKREREARASRKLEAWLKTSRMRSF